MTKAILTESEQKEESDSYSTALNRSNALEKELQDPKNIRNYRVLTGDRPTGRLHIGHYFGSLENRIKMQNLGLEIFIIIADYQVLTDRNQEKQIAEFTRELCIDYLASGIEIENHPVSIFIQSQVPELNQLFIPFLTLVSKCELERNPTIKTEIIHSKQEQTTASMLTYPVHQAADILFCHGNIVPVGRDQLPHIEQTRNIARLFNQRYSPQVVYFQKPTALLSSTPSIKGLDGAKKMSKSYRNTIPLSATPDQVVQCIKKAKTDSQRYISYQAQERPEVANLLQILSLCTAQSPAEWADSIGSEGASRLKKELVSALNAKLQPIRERRLYLEKNLDYIDEVLKRGTEKAREQAAMTITQVHDLMGMYPVEKNISLQH